MAKKGVSVASAGYVAERPSYLPATGAVGRGSEEMTFNDIVVPRLSILQDLSPQHKKNKPEYIPGAEIGMFFNTVTHELYNGEEGVAIIPVYFRPEWVLWKKRTSGGGFLGAYPSQELGAKAVAEQPDKNAVELLDTGQHFILVINQDGSTTEAVLSMAKSQLKASRQLNSLVKLGEGDRFSRVYKLQTTLVNGPKGDYFNWKISQLGFPSEVLYRKAEAMYEAVNSGARSIDRSADVVDDSDL